MMISRIKDLGVFLGMICSFVFYLFYKKKAEENEELKEHLTKEKATYENNVKATEFNATQKAKANSLRDSIKEYNKTMEDKYGKKTSSDDSFLAI